MVSLSMLGTIMHPRLGTFIIDEELGVGSFSIVYAVHHQDYNFKAAIKVYNCSMTEVAELESAEQESNIICGIDYPLIVKGFDQFIWKEHACLLMELANGATLLDYANARGRLSESDARMIIGQLVLCLEHLHRQGICHRDLKCENIIVDQYDVIHMIDFGFAKRYDCVEARDNRALFLTTCGSPCYIAPEIIANQGAYGYEVDIWSMGVIMYAILVGRLPFEDRNMQTLFDMILTRDPYYPDFLSEDAVNLLRGMLTRDPKERITIEGIKESDWLTKPLNGRQQKLDGSFLERIMIAHSKGEFHSHDVLHLLAEGGMNINALITELKDNQTTVNTLIYRITDRSMLWKEVGKCGHLIFRVVSDRGITKAHTFDEGKNPMFESMANLPMLTPAAAKLTFQARPSLPKLSMPNLPNTSNTVVNLNVNINSAGQKKMTLKPGDKGGKMAVLFRSKPGMRKWSLLAKDATGTHTSRPNEL